MTYVVKMQKTAVVPDTNSDSPSDLILPQNTPSDSESTSVPDPISTPTPDPSPDHSLASAPTPASSPVPVASPLQITISIPLKRPVAMRERRILLNVFGVFAFAIMDFMLARFTSENTIIGKWKSPDGTVRVYKEGGKLTIYNTDGSSKVFHWVGVSKQYVGEIYVEMLSNIFIQAHSSGSDMPSVRGAFNMAVATGDGDRANVLLHGDSKAYPVKSFAPTLDGYTIWIYDAKYLNSKSNEFKFPLQGFELVNLTGNGNEMSVERSVTGTDSQFTRHFSFL